MQTVQVFSIPGEVKTVVSNGGKHPPEVWAQLATKRICGISDDAAPHIREQAKAFAHQVRETIAHYLRQALAEQRADIATILEKEGHRVAAEIVRNRL